MHSVQYNQLNDTQKAAAIRKMAAISKELNFTIFGTQNEEGIASALRQDASPDGEFIFIEVSELEVDVKYRENI